VFNIKNFILNSQILGEDRCIYVYIPDSYSSEENYPAVYILDGDANFNYVCGLVDFYKQDASVNFGWHSKH